MKVVRHVPDPVQSEPNRQLVSDPFEERALTFAHADVELEWPVVRTRPVTVWLRRPVLVNPRSGETTRRSLRIPVNGLSTLGAYGVLDLHQVEGRRGKRSNPSLIPGVNASTGTAHSGVRPHTSRRCSLRVADR